MRKLTIALIGLVMACALLAGNAFAASGWAVCTPKKIGPQTDTAGQFVLLKVINCNIDPTDSDPNGFMILGDSGTDQMMAAVLTAMSLGKTISVYFDDAVKNRGSNVAQGVVFTN